jgi:threonine aldolase
VLSYATACVEPLVFYNEEKVMHDFQSDYSGRPHPAVLAALGDLSNTWTSGAYGEDELSRKAEELILGKLFSEEARRELGCMSVFFVPSGTAANALAISTIGGPSYNALVSTDVSHSNRHEAGAMARLGHPMLPIPHRDGKLNVDRLQILFGFCTRDVHEALPDIISFSNATELGTVYMPEEFRCLGQGVLAGTKRHIDGARIANSMASLGLYQVDKAIGGFHFNTMSIGFAKQGGAFGDVLIVRGGDHIESACRFHKQLGYLSSHTQLYAAQVIALLEGDLWLENALHANNMAGILASVLHEQLSLEPVYPVDTNAVFVSLQEKAINLLAGRFGVLWERERNILRFMCAWNTTEDDIGQLLKILKDSA